ncbi:Solute carrier family 40 protein [Gryllus bimaculatus]|nr:Solute carrier family 40 protein [Gryllus bimaculatus]
MQIIRIFRGPLGLLFIAHIIASWGDRMWWFAGGIFMKDLAGFSYHSLLFVGVYTFMVSGTVLTFGAVMGRWIDNTPRLRAFGDTQISTDVVAACQGAAAVMGVLGSISFPQIRKSIQQESIALIGLSLEVISLVLCVVSVWAPGSPFDANSLSTFSDPFEDTGEAILDPEAETKVVGDPTAMICLFAGIIVSRYGLWLTDITITQVMQERIEDNKRGAVNGVQDSLNMAMDMIKSVLVVVFPRPEQFGLLIILCPLTMELVMSKHSSTVEEGAGGEE